MSSLQNEPKFSFDSLRDAQHRRGVFASSGSSKHFPPSSPIYHKRSVASGSSLSALFMNNQSAGAGSSSSSSRLNNNRSRHAGERQQNVYGRLAGPRSNDVDLEKILVTMEKGQRVCKLLLLKKWEPSYKRLYFNRETSQIVLSKNDPNTSSSIKDKFAKPQFLDLSLVKDVQTVDYKMNKMKIADKWKKDKELQRFQLRMELVDASHFLLTERWLRKQFHQIVNPETATVTIRHMKPFVQTTLQYKVQSKQLQEITEGEMGFEAFALAHKRLVNLNSLFQQHFVELLEEGIEGQKVSFSSFYKFVAEQGDSFAKNREDTSNFLRKYFRDVDIHRDVPEPSMSTDEFIDFLFSRENSVFDPINMRVNHDMTKPLTHYWIASSHNTYLTGDQFKSESSLDAYSRALMMGCRCIELDCWDGAKNGKGDFSEIVVYHGYTMTSKLNLRDILYTIKHYAFQSSDYPVILSIEDNCSVPAQRLMAQEIKEILGDLLLTSAVSRDETELPSPAALRRKIILKHKKLQLENEGLLSVTEDEMDSDILSKECTRKGVLYFLEDSTKVWEKHVFVLFDDRLCYILEKVEDETSSMREDAMSQGGEDETAEESISTGFGVRPEEMHVTEEWFHGKVKRDEAKKRLLEQVDKGNGVYLVRESGTFIGDYTLSFLHDRLVHHCRIKTDLEKGEKKYFFLKDNKKDTLYELISYYTKHTLDTPDFSSFLMQACPQPQPHLGEPWYDANADKTRAEQLLNTVHESGAFCIRHSSTDRNVFVLSLRVYNEFWHYRLKRDGRIFVVNQTVFEDLNQIVEYYSTREFVPGICLKFPVNERTVGEYATNNSTTNAGWYMELKDLDREIEAVAIKDFEDISAGALFFTTGAKISIIRKEPDLWKGRCDGRVGWFPPDCIREVGPEANGEMKYVTIELANCNVEVVTTDRLYSFRVNQVSSHWDKKLDIIVAAETKEDMEEWLNALHTLSQSASTKINLLRTKEKQNRLANELSSLVVYCQAVPYDPDFEMKTRAPFYEMCSFSETKHDKLLERKLTLFNSRQLSRVYPQASRLTSTNFNPVPMWASGCHMVALNYQTSDRPMQLNDAKFSANGRCGYVLKPQYMMDETFRPDLANDFPRPGAYPIVLTIKVVAGKHLSRKDHTKGICSPFVEVEITGVSTDCISYSTESITSNGLNPQWNETFVFNIYRPELALLRFTVEDGDFVGPKTDPFIGQAGFPVDCIRPGFRSVPLYNQSSEPCEVSSILIHVDIRPLTDADAQTITSLNPLQTHLRLQADRTTIGESGRRLIKDGGPQFSFAGDTALPRPIPRLSLDSGGDDTSATCSTATNKPVADRKISLNQSVESYSTNSSPRSPHSLSATLSVMTTNTRSTSIDSYDDQITEGNNPSDASRRYSAAPSPSSKKSGMLRKFFKFSK